MIRPEEIRRKAENLYPAFLNAWLAGESFFPRDIPCDKQLDDSLAVARESVLNLRSQSKEVRGFGYSVEWVEKNLRAHGRNQVPRKVLFETEDDFLRLIGKQREFAVFTSAVNQVRATYKDKDLEPWIRSHRQLLIDAAKDLKGLLEVVDYLQTNLRPGLFARELPLSVDTKFIERNERILREWLDLILPPHSIRADENHFARRYGLRYAEPHIQLRFLDDALQRTSLSPWADCSIPLHTLERQHLPATRVLIVENKVNLLTLPSLPGTLAIGGLGDGVMNLRYLNWLERVDLWYWGDIDVDGLAILSRLRLLFPRVRSLLMDDQTIHTWRENIGTVRTGPRVETPTNLTPAEQSAFAICAVDNLRIEQERFPQPFVSGRLHELFSTL